MSSKEISDDKEKIADRRFRVLRDSWERIHLRWRDFENTTLNHHLARVTVTEYLRLRENLKLQNGISDRIQRPKIAGLMAVAILRARPLQLVDESPCVQYGLSTVRPDQSLDNECLALFHGVGIIAEGCDYQQMKSFRNSEAHSEWVRNTIYFLKEAPRPTDAIHLFETMAMSFFPQSMRHDNEP